MSQTIRILSGSSFLRYRLISSLRWSVETWCATSVGLVLVAATHHDGRLRAVQPVERLLVEDCRAPACRDHLRLEPVRRDVLGVVVDEIEADGLDASRRLGDGLLGGVLLLDRAPLLVAPVGEHAIEDLVERLADDLQSRQAALVEDRHRGFVGDGLLDRVLVDVGAEGLAACCGRSCRSACR